MATCKEWMKKGYLNKIGMVSTWKKKKKRKTFRFVDVGKNNCNEREGRLTTFNGSTGKNGEGK